MTDDSFELRQKLMAAEQQWMALKDEYSELARAIGVEGDAWFGDPLASHKEVVQVAKGSRREILRLRKAIRDALDFLDPNPDEGAEYAWRIHDVNVWHLRNALHASEDKPPVSASEDRE